MSTVTIAPSVVDLVSRLFSARQSAHEMHLATRSYAEHMALGDFYDTILGLTDDFIETYQGEYGLIEQPSSIAASTSDPVGYIKGLCADLKAARKDLEDTHLQNLVDEMLSTSYRTLYKLQFLTEKNAKPGVKEMNLLQAIKSRPANGRWGIGTADVYLRQLLTPGFDKPKNWDAMVKRAESTLVYCSPQMLIEKEAGGKFDPTPHAILEFNAIVTTKDMDRDGDVLLPEGARLDPGCALLWQHMPDQPIGKLVRQISKNDQTLRARFAIADTELGRDAATLVEFGALRISHGFLPLKFAPRRSKDQHGNDWEGWEISNYEIMEVSLVSVPSNVGAVITAFSRNKLANPLIKSWAKGLFDARKTSVPSRGIKSTGSALMGVLLKGAVSQDLDGKPNGKPKDEVKPKDDKEEVKDEGDDDMDEREIAKCAGGLRGCGHFGQAFINRKSKTVHHTMCVDEKCGLEHAKEKKPVPGATDGDEPPETQSRYSSDDEIREAYLKCRGVKRVTIAAGYHPPLNKEWRQVHPVNRDWTDAVNNGPQPQQQQQQTDGQEQTKAAGAKFLKSCGYIDGSWDALRCGLQEQAYEYLRGNGVDLPDPTAGSDSPSVYVNISAMFDDHAIVEVWRPIATGPGSTGTECYSIPWSRGEDGKPAWSGDPKAVEIHTEVAVKDQEEAAKSETNHEGTVRGGDEFKSIRHGWKDNGVAVVIGTLKGDDKGPHEAHRFWFDSTHWTSSEAKAWLVANGYPIRGFRAADVSHAVVVTKAGRTLSLANEGHIREAMDCHEEILKLGPEHASKVCKAMLKESKAHLSIVLSCLSNEGDDIQTNGVVTVGDVNAFLAVADEKQIRDASAIIAARTGKAKSTPKQPSLLKIFGINR